MIARDFRPRLASKARLHFDRHTGRHMLLYPEKGLQLNATATEIVKLCDGERTVQEIVDALRTRYEGSPNENLEKEVFGFLEAMSTRGLVEGKP